jgi:hypothetical protein
MLGGSAMLTGALFREKNVLEQAKKLALWGFLLTGIWVGIITYEVNVNRINLIFYPLIFVSAYCIYRLADKSSRWLVAAGVAYALCGALFLGSYFTVYPKEAAQYYNGEFLEAVKCADSMEYADHLYITGNMGWQFNTAMAEILTQYACEIDAAYYQEKSMVTGGRELLPYSERYHFINPDNCDWEACDAEGLYLLHEKDLEKTAEKFEVLQEIGQFRLAVRAR